MFFCFCCRHDASQQIQESGHNTLGFGLLPNPYSEMAAPQVSPHTSIPCQEVAGPEVPKATKRSLGKTISDPDSACTRLSRETQSEWPPSGDARDTMLWKYICNMHRCIPKSELLDWIENVRQFLEAVSVGDHIPTECACSGTGIWSHVNHTLALYWHEEFNLQMKEYQHKWMCEIDAEKRGFCSVSITLRRCTGTFALWPVISTRQVCPTAASVGEISTRNVSVNTGQASFAKMCRSRTRSENISLKGNSHREKDKLVAPTRVPSRGY